MHWVPVLGSHWMEHFICVTSFNPHTHSLKLILLASFFIQETLLKIIALVSDENGIWTNSILQWRMHHFYYTKESIQWEKRKEYSGQRLGYINIKATGEVRWATTTKSDFRTCNQRDREESVESVMWESRNQRMLRRVVKKVKCCRKVRLKTGKPISSNI